MPNIISLKYPSVCSVCGSELARYTRALWNRETRKITCLNCTQLATSTENLAEPLQEEIPKSFEAIPSRPDSGTPGASAKLISNKLHARREARIDERFGRWSGLVKFLFDDPQSTKAWVKGSEGERQIAEALTKRLGDRCVLLHDRKIPGSRANIDHIAVAASGIWIIDTKNYTGALKRVDKGGWLKTDYRLIVNGRDHTSLVQGLHRQASVIQKQLGSTDTPIHSVLCFVNAEWGFLSKPFSIDGVWITYSRNLAEKIAELGPLSEEEVLRVANILAEKLPPA